MKKLWLFFLFFLFGGLFYVSASPKKSNVNYKICIDPGHGGYDGGTKTEDGVWEKDLNLIISLYLRDYLRQAGFMVFLTRDKDMDFVAPGPGTKKKRDLDKRIAIINASSCDFFISIHMNSLGNSRWRGAQVFYQDSFPENESLAKSVQKSMTNVLMNTNREAQTVKTLYLFKTIQKPGILVEAGFLSNPEEAALLKQKKYQDIVAFSIYMGILEYIKENPKDKSAPR